LNTCPLNCMLQTDKNSAICEQQNDAKDTPGEPKMSQDSQEMKSLNSILCDGHCAKCHIL